MRLRSGAPSTVERDPGTGFLVHADVIETWPMKRSGSERLDGFADHTTDGEGQFCGEALSLNYECVAGGHSDKRKSSSSSSATAASSSASSM